MIAIKQKKDTIQVALFDIRRIGSKFKLRT
jgi:hypothetical protein